MSTKTSTTFTLDQFADSKSSNDISYYSMSLLERDPNTNIEYDVFNVVSDYMNELKEMSHSVTLTDTEYYTYRFKPKLLACAKEGKNFNFDLYVESKNSNGNIEAINITDCWIKGKFNLITLQSETDFTTEEYEASFLIENATFEDTIEDGNDWSSKTTTADNN